MQAPAVTPQALSDEQIEQFIQDGFVRVEKAFASRDAEEGRAILWKDTGCDADDPATWTKPVIHLGSYAQDPFARAVNTPMLHQAFDQLAGQKRWLPRMTLGTFPVRFPSLEDPGDAGWHVDTSFKIDGTNPNDFLDWRANVTSRGRALLLLFLFSDVGNDDAPTRIRAGSHLDVARMLAPAGDDGLTLRQLAANDFAETAARKEVLATGEAGTV
ncbi:MAG: phytanoyl-CoA dioxygenase, partial [Bryobacteraceae bacterium]|nr:phytanoyl-CoA dioxygenase [Bryobacteraceae bacterium]